MTVSLIRVLDADTTQLAVTIHGTEWTGIRCHTDGGQIVIDGDGQIPDLAKAYIAAGGVVAAWSDVPLAALKTQLKSRVDADAEATRLRYITPGDGMMLTYTEKHAQARAVVTLGQAAANALTATERGDQFPTLDASVGIEAATLWDCAQLVIARYEAFADLSAVIERTRLSGKKLISDASDAASARAAYEAITWI